MNLIRRRAGFGRLSPAAAGHRQARRGSPSAFFARGGTPDASINFVNILPNPETAPLRLSSAVLEHKRPASAVLPPVSSGQLKKSGLFRGNGVAIFIGLAIAGVALGGISKFLSWREAQLRGDGTPPRLLEVQTKHISADRDAIVAPEPVVVEIKPEHINVTAISLGHPRMAVINGRTVSEGDFLTFRGPAANVTIRLLVKRIGDGQIELVHAGQIIIARIGLPKTKPL
jgi:hypothetical protein